MNHKKLAQLLQTHHADAFRWASQCCHHHRMVLKITGDQQGKG